MITKVGKYKGQIKTDGDKKLTIGIESSGKN